MGISTIALREENGHTSLVDRHSQGCDAHFDHFTASRCAATGGNGEVLSTAPVAEEAQATTEIIQEEVGLHQLWFALSREKRIQFGSHFSEMLLRAVHR